MAWNTARHHGGLVRCSRGRGRPAYPEPTPFCRPVGLHHQPRRRQSPDDRPWIWSPIIAKASGTGSTTVKHDHHPDRCRAYARDAACPTPICYEDWVLHRRRRFRLGARARKRTPAGSAIPPGTTGNPKGVVYTHRSNTLHAHGGIATADHAWDELLDRYGDAGRARSFTPMAGRWATPRR